MGHLEDLELAYLDAAGGNARDALRRALAEAEEEIVALERCVSAGYVRAGRPKAPSVAEPRSLDSSSSPPTSALSRGRTR